jgi:hypothetical protein
MISIKSLKNQSLITVGVFSLLLFIFFLCLLSVKNDSLTFDETAHLPAGYSYLTQRDMRLNPEHPPLIKDLSALPLLFIKDINFPSNLKAWQQDVNGQWAFGNYFLFHANNPADQMILWGRIPIILILIVLGAYIFAWAKTFFNERIGLLALFLFSLSPTFLAHGRLVTTDVGIAAAITIATYYFLKTLKQPNTKNILLVSLTFGLAQLTKFTAIFLIPYFGFLILVWILLKIGKEKQRIKFLIRWFGILGIIFVLGFLVVYLVYLYHVWNYPLEKQAKDIEILLASNPIKNIGPLLSSMAKNRLLKPLAQYLLGLFMVYQRGVGGNNAYFLGEISAKGWKTYFPVVYLIKEPLAFHILTLISICGAALSIKKPFWQKPFPRFKKWLDQYFIEFSILFFVFFYWTITLKGNLNIGVRHLLPVFPFTILLVSKTIFGFFKQPYLRAKYILLSLLLIWQTVSVISVYPHFLAYFNELVGGPTKGYLYVTDSNLDWGQDLKRLKRWVDQEKIDKIYLDYFGGADPRYYLGNKYLAWWGTRSPKELKKPAYLAVSVNSLQGGRAKPVPGFDQRTDYYLWLDHYQPIKIIGHSIFIYYIIK